MWHLFLNPNFSLKSIAKATDEQALEKRYDSSKTMLHIIDNKN